MSGAGNPEPGISGLSVYVPPYRVGLQNWCEWTGAEWQKIRQVVGHGFRILGPGQDVYTMAAAAVLRLIENYHVDPSRVRFLALGTESATDNSAGAIIVKGMVNTALAALGIPALSRNCEVPEVKHACLGGAYALKSALRFLASDGADAQAIVVCSDQALYRRGSSGEPTQGAGAVAMLVSTRPTLAGVNLHRAGTASDFRQLDFRNPLLNRSNEVPAGWRGTPVYNGRYSLNCYLDQMQRALEDLYRRRRLSPGAYLRSLPAVFLHRPYQHLPETAWGVAWLFALAAGPPTDVAKLRRLCRAAQLPPDRVVAEMRDRPDVASLATPGRIQEEAFPLTLGVLRAFRATTTFRQQVLAPLRLGRRAMSEVGNVYTGALFAWCAAGLEEAAAAGVRLTGREILLIGYGSGDAADVIPITPVPGWQRAAKRIGLRAALKPRITLTKRQYLALRERRPARGLAHFERRGFVIDRLGTASGEEFQDLGVAYYRFMR